MSNASDAFSSSTDPMVINIEELQKQIDPDLFAPEHMLRRRSDVRLLIIAEDTGDLNVGFPNIRFDDNMESHMDFDGKSGIMISFNGETKDEQIENGKLFIQALKEEGLTRITPEFIYRQIGYAQTKDDGTYEVVRGPLAHLVKENYGPVAPDDVLRQFPRFDSGIEDSSDGNFIFGTRDIDKVTSENVFLLKVRANRDVLFKSKSDQNAATIPGRKVMVEGSSATPETADHIHEQQIYIAKDSDGSWKPVRLQSAAETYKNLNQAPVLEVYFDDDGNPIIDEQYAKIIGVNPILQKDLKA